MLSVRVTGPADTIDGVMANLTDSPGVCTIVRQPGVVLDGGDVLEFQVAREDANRVIDVLEQAGLQHSGSITLSTPTTVVSDAADQAERDAPGNPDDGVVWDQIADLAEDDSRPSVGFYLFLVLAVLIAGVGRIQDQPVLIVGAMVVGPDFAPTSAMCFAITFGRLRLGLRAAATLLTGFLGAILVSWLLWGALHLAGIVTTTAATTGEQTAFIVHPDLWSFVIAVLAGVAGVLSLTTSKSSAMVGVFISITTVPAVAVVGLGLAVGRLDQSFEALVQLGLNLTGLLIAGSLTLLAQRASGRRIADRLVRAGFRPERPGRPERWH